MTISAFGRLSKHHFSGYCGRGFEDARQHARRSRHSNTSSKKKLATIEANIHASSGSGKMKVSYPIEADTNLLILGARSIASRSAENRQKETPNQSLFEDAVRGTH